MAATEKELLEDTIEYVKGYEKGQAPFRLEVYFVRLQEADQSKNKALWEKLRVALAENRSIDNKAPREFLTRLSLAMEGYWWWNPAEWQQPEPSEQ